MQTIIQKRPADERGLTQIGWLDSRHSFSFGGYDDPEHEAFRALRVINDDQVAPGAGFPEHSHRDMEILTYVISGELSHRDSMGHVSTVKPGQVQYMSAGNGVRHSEFNASATEPVHFLQIWIIPQAHGLRPSYAEWSPGAERKTLTLVAGPEERKGSLHLRQDVSLYIGALTDGETAVHATQPDRGLWLQVIDGRIEAGGELLRAGDGLALEGLESCEITARTDAKFLLFDLG